MIPNEAPLAAAEAYSKASAGGASFEQAFWKALDAVAPLIAAQAWDEALTEAAGLYMDRSSADHMKTTNPYRSQA